MATPLVFDKYEIVRRLAVGGMGEIYLARQTGVAGFDRLVILKSLLPDLARDTNFVDQFLDEARVAATLNHPNIVSIYEVGAWEGIYFIAMEYIHGVSIADMLAEATTTTMRVPFNVAAKITLDSCVALHHAHTAEDLTGKPLNIVHRDISPQNIMVRDDGVTKVVDFGIARAANRATRTATGTVKGKLAYMPPEQVWGQYLDGRSDQCALGIVLWEMCTGRRLLTQDDMFRLAELVKEPVPRPSTFAKDVPRPLEAIILRMTERERESRYPSCAEAGEALKAFLLDASRETSDADVARFVGNVVGDELDSRTRDLTPDPHNFLIDLKRAAGEATDASTITVSGDADTQLRGRARRRTPWVAAALGVVVAGAIAAVVGTNAWRDAQPKPTEASDPVMTVVTPEPPPPSKSVLALATTPAGAEVALGDRRLGITPLDVDSLEADHDYQLTVTLAGHVPETVPVRLAPGENKQVQLRLTREAKKKKRRRAARSPPAKRTPAAGDGFLSIRTTPWTQVTVDGALHGPTPIMELRLPAGRHTIRMVNEGAGIDITRKVTIRSDKVEKVILSL